MLTVSVSRMDLSETVNKAYPGKACTDLNIDVSTVESYGSDRIMPNEWIMLHGITNETV